MTVLAGLPVAMAGKLAGTSSFGMSGVNAHMLMSHEQRFASFSNQPRASQQWQRSRHSIAARPHLLLELTLPHSAAPQHCTFSFRTASAALSSLYSVCEGGRCVLPPAVLLHMAAATAGTLLQEGTAGTAGISSAVLPAPAVLPDTAAENIVMLDADVATGKLYITSSAAPRAVLMSASYCQIQNPSSTSRTAYQPLAARILLPMQLPDAAVSPVLMGMLDSSALTHQAADSQTAMLTAVLGVPRANPMLAAAACFQPQSLAAQLPQHSSTHWHMPGTETDARLGGDSDRSCTLTGISFRPARSAYAAGQAASAEPLQYALELQAAYTSPAPLPLTAPPGVYTVTPF